MFYVSILLCLASHTHYPRVTSAFPRSNSFEWQTAAIVKLQTRSVPIHSSLLFTSPPSHPTLHRDRLSRLQQEPSLLRPHHLRLPVLLTAAEVTPQSGRLVVSVLHYPPLLRVADWCRGRGEPTASWRDAPLTCNIAGAARNNKTLL